MVVVFGLMTWLYQFNLNSFMDQPPVIAANFEQIMASSSSLADTTETAYVKFPRNG